MKTHSHMLRNKYPLGRLLSSLSAANYVLVPVGGLPPWRPGKVKKTLRSAWSSWEMKMQKERERERESQPVQLPRADPARIKASLSLSFCIGHALATE